MTTKTKWRNKETVLAKRNNGHETGGSCSSLSWRTMCHWDGEWTEEFMLIIWEHFSISKHLKWNICFKQKKLEDRRTRVATPLILNLSKVLWDILGDLSNDEIIIEVSADYVCNHSLDISTGRKGAKFILFVGQEFVFAQVINYFLVDNIVKSCLWH